MRDLDAILSGDETAWRRVVEEYSPLLRGLAGRTFSKYGYSFDPSTCEDIASQVWVNLLANDRKVLKTCRDRDAWMPMLHTLVRNRCIDHIRKTRNLSLTDQEPLPVEEAVAPKPAPGMEREWLIRHVQSLSDRERTVIDLFFLQELSYREIHEVSGIPENSIGPTLKRALKRLRKRIEAEDVKSESTVRKPESTR